MLSVAILEDVDVVIAAANRPELLACEMQQLALPGDGRRVDRIEHLVLAHGRGVRSTHPEGDAARDLVGDARVLSIADVRRVQMGADRQVAARDVVPDAARRDVIAVADHAADRHRIAEVSVRAEHRLRAGSRCGTAFELLDRRRFVLAENLDVAHAMLIFAVSRPE
jgi:hypothetical protein